MVRATLLHGRGGGWRTLARDESDSRMRTSSTDTDAPTTQPRTNRPARGFGNGGADACLVVLQGQSLGQRIDLGACALTFGRAAECDFHIDERSVSRQHARIWRDHGGYRLKDLGSTNKTLLNDVPVGEAELKDGDYVTIGSSVLKFMERSSVEARYHEEIYQLATLDPLTGLSNRRHFLELFGRELQRAQRHRRPLSLLIVDLDHFKDINDSHGHVVGDGVLEQVASALQSAARGEAIAARIGGEEFAIALPEHDLEASAAVAESLRAAIAALPLQLGEVVRTVTVSIGVAAWRPGMSRVGDMLGAADQALYGAKEAGRNRVVVAE